MTDEQIIKGLECCNDGACEHCPFGGKECYSEVRKEAIDLINRQKSTIDELTKAYKSLKSEKNAEIEMLKDDKNRLEKMMDNLGKELDAEKNKNF